jgi:hypothetical protein
MCGESETKSTTVRNMPAYIDTASKALVKKGTDVLEKPFEAYTAPRVADLTADQMSVFQKLRDLVSSSPIVMPQAQQNISNYTNAPAQNVQTERVVDESGRLGAISDYMNPNLEAALAPALRKIQEAADLQRKKIGAGATSAGAFGDARHGILEGTLGRDTSTAMGDVAGKFYSDAFDKAMAARTGDLSRFLTTDTANAGYGETALGRQLTGANAQENLATADQNRMLTQLQALLSGGGAQQTNEQAKLDATFQEFLRKYGNDANVINALSAALKGASPDWTQTTTNTQPDNSIMQTIGAIAPYALAPFTGGASLALAPLTLAGGLGTPGNNPSQSSMGGGFGGGVFG